MKQCLLLILIFYTATVLAQTTDTLVNLSHYVFDQFYPGKVYLKSHKVSEQLLNYNALTEEMIFNNNGQNLAIAQPEEVDSVVIQSRRFVLVNNKFYEQLTDGSFPLFKEYVCKIKEPGADIGFGATTTTTGTSSIKTLINSGGVYNLKLPNDYQVEMSVYYWIKKEGSFYKINNAQQLVKIFPDKKKLINDFIKTNNIRFSQQKEVILLVQAIQQ